MYCKDGVFRPPGIVQCMFNLSCFSTIAQELLAIPADIDLQPYISFISLCILPASASDREAMCVKRIIINFYRCMRAYHNKLYAICIAVLRTPR